MNSNNGNGGIYVSSIPLERREYSWHSTMIILPIKSTKALREFLKYLHNTGSSLEQLLNSRIELHDDGKARIVIPNNYNGSADYTHINLDTHETQVLADKLRSIGTAKVETRPGAEPSEEAQRRLEEFLELYQ